jgi:bifunctional DNA-binding transcriptional regulator/antitoxin component of YhaV-PrlF toxin-antitoxin module
LTGIQIFLYSFYIISRKKGGLEMLAKITSKNQITIPKGVIEQFPGAKYVEVEIREGTIVLTPVREYGTDLNAIREKMSKLGLTEESIAEAVRWAREK